MERIAHPVGLTSGQRRSRGPLRALFRDSAGAIYATENSIPKKRRHELRSGLPNSEITRMISLDIRQPDEQKQELRRVRPRLHANGRASETARHDSAITH